MGCGMCAGPSHDTKLWIGTGGATVSYVLALVDNLFFQARIQAVAKQIGVEVKVVPTGEELVSEATARPPALVIVDLNARSGGLETVRGLRSDGTDTLVIGFLPHTQTELAEQAKAAGCDKVMSQGRFTEELPVLLARARDKIEHPAT
jgi:CheY-like chemotaxis protein